MEKESSPPRQSARRIALGVSIAVFLVALGIALAWPDRYRATVTMTPASPVPPSAEPTSVTEIPIWLPDPYGFPSPWRIDFSRLDAALGDARTTSTPAGASDSRPAPTAGGQALWQMKQQLLSLGRTVLGRRPLAALNHSLEVFPELTAAGASTSEVVRHMSRNLRIVATLSVAASPEPAASSGSPGTSPRPEYSPINGLSLSFEHEDPDIARPVARRLADEFAESLNAARVTGPTPPTEETLAWLVRMADQRRREILRLQSRRSAMTPRDPGYSELEQTLNDAGRELAELEKRLRALEQERRCRTAGCPRRVVRLVDAQLPATRVGPSRPALVGLAALAGSLSGLGIIAVAGGRRRLAEKDPKGSGRGVQAGEGGET